MSPAAKSCTKSLTPLNIEANSVDPDLTAPAGAV